LAAPVTQWLKDFAGGPAACCFAHRPPLTEPNFWPQTFVNPKMPAGKLQLKWEKAGSSATECNSSVTINYWGKFNIILIIPPILVFIKYNLLPPIAILKD